MPITLSISPHGCLHVVEASAPEDSSLPEGPYAVQLREQFALGSANGLLHLGAVHLQDEVPDAFGFARDIAKAYLTRLCQTPDLEGANTIAPIPAPGPYALSTTCLSAPPMKGSEYLTAEVLSNWWTALDERVLRGVDHLELISAAGDPMILTPQRSAGAISDDDLSEVFGIELDIASSTPSTDPTPSVKAPPKKRANAIRSRSIHPSQKAPRDRREKSIDAPTAAFHVRRKKITLRESSIRKSAAD